MSHLITFEGIDGSGKSTQVTRVEKWLREEGYDVLLTREPGGSELGEAIRSILLDHKWSMMHGRTEFLLYSASRAQMVEEIVKPHLKKPNGIVLIDRYDDSSTAYQGGGRKLGIDAVETVNHFATDNLTPDLTFVLDVDWETSRARLSSSRTDPDRLENNPRDFFERTRQAYHDLCTRYPDRMRLIDATESPDEVYNKIVLHLNKLL
ncbi:dTMP kinase [bacterium]|nr:dTMP kinase [bacterium]